jgi:hypothetical protein
MDTRKGVVSGEVPIHAVLNDTEKSPVGYVAFVVDGQRPYISNAAPYGFTWDTTQLPSGVYRIAVEVYGTSGQLLYKTPAQKVRVKSSASPAEPLPVRGVSPDEEAA